MANLKGGNAIVRFLLAHGEKIGIAAVGICAAMLIWSALKHDHLGPDKQPNNLVQLASQASEHVKSFKWDDLDPNSKLIAKPVPGGAMVKVASKDFPPIPDPWTNPVLDPVRLRTDPELLTAEDLEVYGDSGMWVSANPDVIKQKQVEAIKEQERIAREEAAAQEKEQAEDDRGGRGGRGERGGRGDGRRGRGRDRGGLDFGGERGGRDREERPAKNTGPIVVSSGSRNSLEGFEQIDAKSWVTIVAKVPIEKQYGLYDEALMSSSGYNQNQDVPIYRGYIVERAEVTDEGQGEWAMVAKVGQQTLDNKVATYPFDPEELVSDHYLHPLLTHPLPPLILRDWDRRVTHTAIPLAVEQEAADAMESEGTEESEKVESGDDFAASAGDAAGGERGSRPGVSRRGNSGSPATRGGGEGAYREGGGGGGRSYSRGGGAGSFSWDGQTPYVLFRYFDDDVKAGHRYRYRVRLALADVNNEVSEQFLDKTVSERRGKLKDAKEKAIRLTEWSEPSPVASVPLPARVYLVSAEAANAANYYAEPEARVLVQAFNSTLPAEIALEEAFLRGAVLNLHNKASVIWVDRADLTEEQEGQEFDFRTGITVVDFRGGEKLGGKNKDLTAPARAVLMDPAGRLFLQSELDDSEPVKTYKDALEGGQDGRGGFEGRRGREEGEGRGGGGR